MAKLSIAILIPARYGSTRFPGKPLALINGRAMVDYVYEAASCAVELLPKTDFYIDIAVTSDDERILGHCSAKNFQTIETDANCATGTDRVWLAAQKLKNIPDFIVNLQGDAPLTPPDFIVEVIKGFGEFPDADIITPVVPLSWGELDELRAQKLVTPFSGTTAVLEPDGRAIWFSKQIVPAIVKEQELRISNQKNGPASSPVYRHIGLYGFRRKSLEKYVTLKPSYYEQLEGLEQLRALEAGLIIQTVKVKYNGRPAMTGVDSPEDLKRVEQILKKKSSL